MGQTDLNLEDVTLPALILYQKFDLLCGMVAVSTSYSNCSDADISTVSHFRSKYCSSMLLGLYKLDDNSLPAFTDSSWYTESWNER